MAREFAPIIEVKYPRSWPNDLITNVLEEFEISDDFTYTMRLAVPEEKRQEVRDQLKERGAEDLVKLLDEHAWDVSFFVDTY